MAASRVPRVVIFSCVPLPDPVSQYGPALEPHPGAGVEMCGLYDYGSGQVQWFDSHNNVVVLESLMHEGALLVGWDLMGSGMGHILRELEVKARTLHYPEQRLAYQTLWERLQAYVSVSFDMYQAVWGLAGTGTLRELCVQNGIGTRDGEIHGMSSMWQAGRKAEALNALTAMLAVSAALLGFMVCSGGWLVRNAERIRVALPQPLTHAIQVIQNRHRT